MSVPGSTAPVTCPLAAARSTRTSVTPGTSDHAPVRCLTQASQDMPSMMNCKAWLPPGGESVLAVYGDRSIFARWLAIAPLDLPARGRFMLVA